MIALVLGGDVAAMVATYAITISDHNGGCRAIVPSFDGTVSLMCPVTNDLVPAGIPALGKAAEPRKVYLQPSGRAEDWADKVGRPDRIAEHFPHNGATEFFAHLSRDLFNSLAPGFASFIGPWQMDKQALGDIVNAMHPDVIINTLPRQLLCEKPDDHGFPRQQVWVSHLVGPQITDNHVLVNAEDAPAWYTASKFDGHLVTKWLGQKPPFNSIQEDSVPISTNCDCAPFGMVHVGAVMAGASV